MKRIISISLLLFFAAVALFALDGATIKAKLPGKWVAPKNAYNQYFYYTFNANNTGHVYYTQSNKTIGEYDISYTIEDTFLVIKTPGGDIIWEIAAITDTIMVIRAPGGTAGEVYRRVP